MNGMMNGMMKWQITETEIGLASFKCGEDAGVGEGQDGPAGRRDEMAGWQDRQAASGGCSDDLTAEVGVVVVGVRKHLLLRGNKKGSCVESGRIVRPEHACWARGLKWQPLSQSALGHRFASELSSPKRLILAVF